jgi:hypothetical protein
MKAVQLAKIDRPHEKPLDVINDVFKPALLQMMVDNTPKLEITAKLMGDDGDWYTATLTVARTNP